MRIQELLMVTVIAASLPVAAQIGAIDRSVLPIDRTVHAETGGAQGKAISGDKSTTGERKSILEQSEDGGTEEKKAFPGSSWSPTEFRKQSKVPEVVGGQMMGRTPEMPQTGTMQESANVNETANVQEKAKTKPWRNTGKLTVSSVNRQGKGPGGQGAAGGPGSRRKRKPLFSFSGKVTSLGDTRASDLKEEKEKKKFSAEISSHGGPAWRYKQRRHRRHP